MTAVQPSSDEGGEGLTEVIAELWRLDANRTPGAWKTWGMTVMADQAGTSNVDDAVEVAHTGFRDENGKPRTWDADIIATTIRNLPALLAAASRAESAEAALDAARRERDEARVEVAEVRYELGDALTTLETALMGTPSSGCVWSVVGAPSCEAGTRAIEFWCRHCLVRGIDAARRDLVCEREARSLVEGSLSRAVDDLRARLGAVERDVRCIHVRKCRCGAALANPPAVQREEAQVSPADVWDEAVRAVAGVDPKAIHNPYGSA